MAGNWPRIIRDPVHNIISFDSTRTDQLLLDLINSKEMQRLRRIKQLGMSELVFPGANHNRFAHCIGVMQITRKFLYHIKRLKVIELSPEQETLLLCAALLHDIGHGPFSHAFEKITNDKHEKRTLEIIQNSSTEVYKNLKNFSNNFPEQLGMFFEEKNSENVLPQYLIEIISSQMDADRFDYLLRDSLCTGTDYGEFDLEWLIHHILIDENKKQIYLSQKGLYAAEAYVFARYHMYRTVYYHKATRSAEVILRLIFERYKENPAAVTDVPKAFAGAFSSKEISLDEYLDLDDGSAVEFFRCCSKSKDNILQTLANRLLHRRLYKAIDVTGLESDRISLFYNEVLEYIRKNSFDGKYHFAYDIPSDTPYKPYDPDEEQQAAQIRVENEHFQPTEISKLSEPIDELKKKYQLLRYYFPEEIREDVEKIAKEKLHKK